MFRKILIPLDGSERAESALPLVTALAGAFDASLVLLRVLGGGDADRSRFPADPAEGELERRQALSYLNGIRGRLGRDDLTVEVLTRVGNPAHEIVDTARETHSDLVAITSHGEGGDARFPIAGTAHKVLITLETSVLLLPAGNGWVWPGDLKRVLVPLDGSPRAEWALRAAMNLSAGSGPEIVAVHVVCPPGYVGRGQAAELDELARSFVDLARRQARAYLRDAAARLAVGGTEARTRVEVAACIPEGVLRVAGEEDADLVLLTAHGATASEGCPFGTVTRGLVDRSDLPMLILQDAPPHPVGTEASGHSAWRWAPDEVPSQ